MDWSVKCNLTSSRGGGLLGITLLCIIKIYHIYIYIYIHTNNRNKITHDHDYHTHGLLGDSALKWLVD